MNTVNFSKNNINDILKQAKQIETEQLRQNLKKKPVTKHLNQIESTGVIDAINYAPKHDWQHLFTNIPVSDYIDIGFVNKNDATKNAFKELKDVQNEKQWYKNFRNGFGGVAIGAGIAAATLTPLGQVAGLGYLAGWASTALATSTISTLGAITTQTLSAVNNIHEKEKLAIDGFTKALDDYAKDNITDMHKYWSAVDKLSKVPMTEEQALNTLSNLYTEANNKLREQHNVSLVDVYLSSEDKSHLKSYGKVEPDSYKATSLTKDMQQLPPEINDDNGFYLQKGSLFSNYPNAYNLPTSSDDDDKINELNKVIGFKLHALENAGVVVDKKRLGLSNDTSLDNINEALNKHYGTALDDAFLIYQGKHSMASPIIDKVEKVLQNALELFSKEAIKQAKARNLKKVPEITGQLVEKILSAVMLQTSIPANDTKLTKILNAIANNTALKVAANLNNYASDTDKAEKNKVLYAKASLDNLYDDEAIRVQNAVKQLNKKDISGVIDYAENETVNMNLPKNAMKDFAKYLSGRTGKPVVLPLIPHKEGDAHLIGRRWKYIPHIIPGVTGNKIDFTKPENKKYFSQYLSSL